MYKICKLRVPSSCFRLGVTWVRLKARREDKDIWFLLNLSTNKSKSRPNWWSQGTLNVGNETWQTDRPTDTSSDNIQFVPKQQWLNYFSKRFWEITKRHVKLMWNIEGINVVEKSPSIINILAVAIIFPLRIFFLNCIWCIQELSINCCSCSTHHYHPLMSFTNALFVGDDANCIKNELWWCFHVGIIRYEITHKIPVYELYW